MKATIDRDGCIGCGLCADTCPEVFQLDDDGIAETRVAEIPEDAQSSAVDAQDACPVSVITVD